jgi:NitT/TauT family transport system permease protein
VSVEREPVERWRVAAPLVVAVAVIVLWQAWTVLADVPTYLVPSPLVVAKTLVTDAGLLLASLGVTVSIALMALGIAIVVGVAIALVFVQSRWIEAAFTPYVVLMQVTPIVAIAPLIIIWVRDTQVALVLCAVVVAIFPIVSDTTLGLRSVDPRLIDLFRMNRATRWQVLTRLRIPSALPYFFGGLRIASGLALIGAVVAEFRRRNGRPGRGARLPDPDGRDPAQHPAAVRRPGADHARGRRVLRHDRAPVALRAATLAREPARRALKAATPPYQQRKRSFSRLNSSVAETSATSRPSPMGLWKCTRVGVTITGTKPV